MDVLSLVAGVALIAIVLWDAFETIVLPRLVTRQIRLARYYFRYTWRVWAAIARSIRARRRRENFLGFYGPLFMLLLMLQSDGLQVLLDSRIFRRLDASL